MSSCSGVGSNARFGCSEKLECSEAPNFGLQHAAERDQFDHFNI